MTHFADIRTGNIRRTAVWLLFLACMLLPGISFGKDHTVQTVPNVRLSDKHNYVSNPDGILNPADIQYINLALKQLEDSLGIEVAVVALESIGGNDARMFATDLFEYWGIGKKGEDNGLLVQLVTEPSQRSVVFETGYGLEGILPDAICYRIQQQYMITDLKEARYSAGMLNGVMAVKDYLMAGDHERSRIAGTSRPEDDPIMILYLIVGFPLLILALSIVAYKRKYRKRICPSCGQKTFSYVRREIVTKPTYRSQGLAVDIYRCTNCGYTERKNHTLNRLHQGGSSGPVIFGHGGGSWGGGRSGGGGSISRF